MIASKSYSCSIWVFFVGADLIDYFFVSYLIAAILRAIFLSDDLKFFRPGDTLFFGSVIPSTKYLAETA